MEYRPLGRTGMKVSTFALGTMVLGAWGNQDHDECQTVVHRALDAGVNLVDTADVYAFGESEEIVGKALAGRRNEVILATKFHNPMGEGLNERGNSRRWIMQACEASLRRLGTDWIDLYQVHRPDPATDIDETLSALSDLVHAGKIRAFGTSTFPAWQLVEAQAVAAQRGRERPTTEQPPYSILARGIEREVLPACEAFGLGVVVWAPLNGGWLTGKYQGDAPQGSRAVNNAEHFDYGGPAHQAKQTAVAALQLVADEAGLRLVDLAHAFVLAHPAVTAAIMGPKTVAQLEDTLRGVEVTLTDDILDAVDAIIAPGRTLNPYDDGYDPPGLADPAARRRRMVRPSDLVAVR
jgi:aryl-alcohol dehydrogenase-like predicted oxidoreductase